MTHLAPILHWKHNKCSNLPTHEQQLPKQRHKGTQQGRENAILQEQTLRESGRKKEKKGRLKETYLADLDLVKSSFDTQEGRLSPIATGTRRDSVVDDCCAGSMLVSYYEAWRLFSFLPRSSFFFFFFFFLCFALIWKSVTIESNRFL